MGRRWAASWRRERKKRKRERRRTVVGRRDESRVEHYGEVLISWQWPRHVSRCAFASHTVPLHWQLQRHIWLPITTREHSSLGPRAREIAWRGKKGEDVKGDLKYAAWDKASPWVFANSPTAEAKIPDRGIKIHGTHRIPRTPIGYLPCHMGNNGLHNLDMEKDTFPTPCYTKIWSINAHIEIEFRILNQRLSVQTRGGLKSHPPTLVFAVSFTSVFSSIC